MYARFNNLWVYQYQVNWETNMAEVLYHSNKLEDDLSKQKKDTGKDRKNWHHVNPRFAKS